MADGMVTLPCGEAYLHADGLSAPIRVVTPDTEKALRLNKALPDERVRRHMGVQLPPPFSQCAACGDCDHCDPELRANARFVAMRLTDRPEVARCLADPRRQAELAGFLGAPFGETVRETLQQFQMSTDDSRMQGCAKAQFIRALLLSPQWTLPEEALTGARTGPCEPVTPDNILELCAPDEQPGGEKGGRQDEDSMV